jgi:hypothetical protein
VEHLLACSCGEVLVKSANGTTKIRGKVLLFRDGKGYVVCKGCGAEQAVPVQLNNEGLPASKVPRLFVTGGGSK